MFKSIVSGISVGMTAGSIAYAVSKKTQSGKKKLKKTAGKAMKSIGDFFDGIQEMLR